MAWNRWYSQPNERLDTILLDGHEVKTLSQLVDKTEIFRILYCGMIDRCVRLVRRINVTMAFIDILCSTSSTYGRVNEHIIFRDS